MMASTQFMGSMIKISAIGPKPRLKTIQDWRTKLAYERQEKLKAWGLEVGGIVE